MKKITFSIIIACLFSCSYKNLEVVEDYSEYPREVSEILIKKCATSGCHNSQSKEAAGGISLETWSDLFKGGRSGAVVVPYSADYSTLLYFVNVDSLLGLRLEPQMPYNSAPLSAQEYAILKNWILIGAPDKNGFVKFSDNPHREKLYVANRASDMVNVIDLNSGLIMRCIGVGNSPGIESPHMLRCSDDNNYWYTIFYSGTKLQKFNSADNTFVSEVELGASSWNSISISSDNSRAFITSGSGNIAIVDLLSMTLLQQFAGLNNALGCALNKFDDTLYVIPPSGNFICKIPVNNSTDVDTISLEPGILPNSSPSLDPNFILFNNDHSIYYVACRRSNEVRVMQSANDSLLAIIPVSGFPVEMALSGLHPYLFISCMSEPNSGNTILGRIDVVDINTNSVIKSTMPGHQPHGIAVSDTDNRLYIANRNVSHGGPAAHHPSPFGKNGYLTAIDMSTLELVPGFKSELSVDPYSLDISR